MRVVDLLGRPDLVDPALRLGDVGGEFLYRGPGGKVIAPERLLKHWGRYSLVLLDTDDTLLARALSIPVAFPTEDRPELPDEGWDAALRWAVEDLVDGRAPTTLVALEIVVAPQLLGTGLSTHALKAFKARAVETGLSRLVAPVRPIGKEAEPEVPMPEYAARRREDGLFADRWLRTHERLGAKLVKIAPFALTVTGTLGQWRDWTGVKLTDGPNRIPGGIAPVHASVSHDVGIYVEPNVWMDHPL